MTVFYHTSEHDRGDPMRSVSTVMGLPEAANDSRHLIQAALHGAAKTWKDPGATPWLYSKAGLVTTDLVPLDEAPRPLFDALDRGKVGKLMTAMDACNARFGRSAVGPARAGLPEKRTWSTTFETRSPRFTTRLNDVPTVSATAL